MSDPGESNRFKFDWQRKVLACRLGTASTAVALALSIHANKKGGNAHPGVRLLAHETELSERTVRRCLENLRVLGLLRRILSGSRAEHRNYADVYELTLPDDLKDRVDVIEKPTTETRAPNRGGKANHVRWHENRNVVDSKCSYCDEALEGLARAREDYLRGSGRSADPIRPPVRRNPTIGQTDIDHRSVEEYQQGFTNTTLNQHSDDPPSGPRASSRAQRGYDFDDDCCDYVLDAFEDNLDVDEMFAVEGMLAKGHHPKEIVNMIVKRRREEAA